MVHLPLYEDDRPAETGGGCGDCESVGGSESKCGNGLEKIYNTTAVRYGYMKHVGEFTHGERMKFTCGAKVVVQTNRGIEIGEQVSLGCDGCDRHVSREQIKSYIAQSGADSYRLANGRILREATPDDLSEDLHLKDRTRGMLRTAQTMANSCLGSDRMKMVECEHLLGGERAIFYFMAEGRIDFRTLVKDLSHEFQTRIQMHQVGARDEARLLADYETCGREVCCKVFLKTLRPISMRMAKLQRATLDPSKVSGRCGRLKCCLRYEHESYETLDAKLPRRGEKINTEHGYGTVVDRQILTQLVRIDRAHEEGQITVVIEDILERKLASFPAPPPPVEIPTVEPPKRDSSRRRRPAGRPRSGAAKESQPPRPKSETRGRRPAVRRDETAKPEPDNKGPGEPTAQPPEGGGPPKRRRRRRRRGRGGSQGDKPPANG